MRVDLPYGTRPYPIDLGDRHTEVLEPPTLPEPPAVGDLLAAALDEPHGSPLTAPAGGRVTIVISDASRNEPRAALIEAVRARLPSDVRLTLAIATGTHGPTDIAALGLPEDLLRDATIVNHDGNSDNDLVKLGTTTRGTQVMVHRCVVNADLVIATGCIRPHYFAGFGAGAKAIFPGLGDAAGIRVNHRLKLEPRARSGIVDGNPCREDIEEAFELLPTEAFLLNGVCDIDDRVQAAVAGDVVMAFRAGADLARPWFTLRATPAPLVIASDALPVSGSLYQAAKIAAAVAPLVGPNGTLVIVAECQGGIGPLDIVNEAVFGIGVLPRLAPGVRLVLVSGLDAEQTNQTLLAHSPSVAHVLESTLGRVIVVPRASKLIIEAAE